MNKQALEILKNLVGATVRITVKTNSIARGTMTYPDFISLESDMVGDTIKGQVMFKEGTGTVGRVNQKLVAILKIEVFDGGWLEKFTTSKKSY